jgi:hypothetical protein
LNETIPAHLTFADVGGYVVQADKMNKIIALAGGIYIEIETFPDTPANDAMGLSRVHFAGVDPLVTGTAAVPSRPIWAPSDWNHALALGPVAVTVFERAVFAKVLNAPPVLHHAVVSFDALLHESALPVVWHDVSNTPKSASITMQLIRPQVVTSVKLCNPHDAGINEFTLEFSIDGIVWFARVAGRIFEPRPEEQVCSTVNFLQGLEMKLVHFIKFTPVSTYGDRAALASFRIFSENDQPVATETTKSYVFHSLASRNFGDDVRVELAVVQPVTPAKARFTVTYTDQAPYPSFQERYHLKAGVLTITGTVLALQQKAMAVTFPVFLTDGQRVTTVKSSTSAVCVQLAGDRQSLLNTTSAVFAVIVPPGAVLKWEPALHRLASRNGEVQAYIALIEWPAPVDNPSVTYSLTPVRGLCPASF